VADRVTFRIEDLFTTDLRPATVLTLYLFRELNIQLRPRILEQMRPGTRVVTHDWTWASGSRTSPWSPAPDKPVGLDRNSKIFLWYIPAKMAGRWQLETTFRARAYGDGHARAGVPALRGGLESDGAQHRSTAARVARR